MTKESLQTIPREKRPTPDMLEGYERQHDLDPDLSMYRRELSDFIYDYRREEEENRERGSGRQELEGHNEYLVDGARRGFDPNDFDIDQVVQKVSSRPLH